MEEDPLDVGPELALDERLVRVFGAELRDAGHLVAETRHVVGRREDAAGELLVGEPLDDHRRLLRRLADRFAVDVFVDDRFADQEHLQPAGLLQGPRQFSRRVAAGEVGEVGLHLRRQHAHVLVDERGGTEGLAAGEGQPTARLPHRRLLLKDLAGDVLGRVFVVRSLHVDVGLDQTDRLDSRGRGVDGDEVDALERREHLGPELLGERRPVRPLVDMLVGRDGDDEHVAHRPGFFEVPQVADVEQVEHAVAMDDLPPLAAEAGKGGGEFR